MLDETDEAERLELVAEVHRLCDELDVYSPTVRTELGCEPARAVRILEHARDNAAMFKSAAGYAVARFRAGYDPAAPSIGDEPPAPLDRVELEAALEWTLANSPSSPAVAAIRELLAKAD